MFMHDSLASSTEIKCILTVYADCLTDPTRDMTHYLRALAGLREMDKNGRWGSGKTKGKRRGQKDMSVGIWESSFQCLGYMRHRVLINVYS